MKSAFELAMERLNKSAPAKKLTAAQKAEIADLDSLYKSKIAEQEIRFSEQISAAEAAGESDKAHELRQTLAAEKQKLSEQAEARKDRVRNG